MLSHSCTTKPNYPWAIILSPFLLHKLHAITTSLRPQVLITALFLSCTKSLSATGFALPLYIDPSSFCLLILPAFLCCKRSTKPVYYLLCIEGGWSNGSFVQFGVDRFSVAFELRSHRMWFSTSRYNDGLVLFSDGWISPWRWFL
ncbi:hypothetical protein MPH_11143 [Macrophomina phaseolina MS6]|uniref:Uncharacterized protein n=1 Tax=Macrophomina phaseolina (strain MS6) TaxID=1126212 RepID=K2S4L1_MACPH|nr:hypothetical protein MPH_11143 [Macrophomina phaseolina MS6]